MLLLPVVSKTIKAGFGPWTRGRAVGMGAGFQVQAQPAFTEPNNMLAHMSWNMHIYGTYI